jgi:predicted RNase H-related nuclease YkuK (DUF458 family)
MRVFKNKEGKKIEDILEYVKNWISTHQDSEIYIGCDSQEINGKTNYVTTICMYEIGKGVHVIYNKEQEPRSNSMHSRLWLEVEKSIEVAEIIKDIDKKITLHIDYNSKQSGKSNQLYEAGIGYVKSMGYDAVGKPNAWAASTAADNFCR